MAGRHTRLSARADIHAEAPKQQTRDRSRPARALSVKAPPSFKRALACFASMASALALAATVAVPAVSASAALQPNDDSLQSRGTAEVVTQSQNLTVGADAAVLPIVRDASDIIHSYKPAGASIASIGGWVAPINRRIVSPWGPRQAICTAGVGCDSGFHRGDDFAAACGTPFYSVSAGVVVAITHGGLAGDEIVISHGGDISTAYSHMFDSGILVSVGQKVSVGQNIGLIGSSGDSTGCHLYFEYRVGGITVDPQAEMAAHGITLGVV